MRTRKQSNHIRNQKTIFGILSHPILLLLFTAFLRIINSEMKPIIGTKHIIKSVFIHINLNNTPILIIQGPYTLYLNMIRKLNSRCTSWPIDIQKSNNNCSIIINNNNKNTHYNQHTDQ